MKRAFTAAIFALCTSNALASDDPISLTVVVDSGEPGTGQIVATLFGSQETYMKEPIDEKTAYLDSRGQSELTFDGLQTGDYAISVYYDENTNGQLDTNFLGIPKEKIGFSNDAQPRLGPAPYDEARFTLSADHNSIRITLNKAD